MWWPWKKATATEQRQMDAAAAIIRGEGLTSPKLEAIFPQFKTMEQIEEEFLQDRGRHAMDRYDLSVVETEQLIYAMRIHRTDPSRYLRKDWFAETLDGIAPGKREAYMRKQELNKRVYEAGRAVIMDAADKDLTAAAMEGMALTIPERIFASGKEFANYDPNFETEMSWSTSAEQRREYQAKGLSMNILSAPIEGEPCRIYARNQSNEIYRRMKDGVVVRVGKRANEVTVKFDGFNVTVGKDTKFMRRDVNNHLRLYIPLSSNDAKRMEEHHFAEAMKRYCEGDVVITEAFHKQENETMMSRDRVEFQYGGYIGQEDSQRRTASVRAGIEALGIYRLEAEKAHNAGAGPITVICRPSQFARFLILRNEYGGTNDFKGLKAKLVPAIEKPVILDVAANRNTVQL